AYENSIMKEGALAGLYQVALVRGEFDRAAQYAEQLDDLSGGRPWTRAMPIETLIRAGEQKKADKATAAALESITEPKERRAFLRELAKGQLAAGHFAEAERTARQARELDEPNEPDEVTARFLAWSLMNQGKTDEAERVIAEAIAEHPYSADLRVYGSFNALIAGDAETAERRAAEVLARGPAISAAHVALAYALGQQGKFDRAVPHAERALAMGPDRTSRTLLAWVLIAGEIDLERGLELAVKAVDTPDSYFEAANDLSCMALAEHCLGVAYLKQGRYDEAVAVLTEASRLRPEHAAIREQLEQASQLSVQSGS
ncbi:MAG TPA: tetratricopeptide repeat protein, partial [Candidatus Polarisedimenticolaceae bacterium]|nr:tetratricopeptide repeat protein [Candidatus Polarisedimenticolaceae bacterium]